MVDNLQKNYKEELGVVQGARLLTKALCEIVDNPKQNLEIAVITEKSTRFLSVDEIEKLVASIEEEQPKK